MLFGGLAAPGTLWPAREAATGRAEPGAGHSGDRRAVLLARIDPTRPDSPLPPCPL